MIITLDNLRRGLEHHNKMWPNDVDVRNTIYEDIYNVRAQGVTHRWWDVTVERLSKWGANRGRKKEWIRERGIRQLGQIRKLYEKLITIGEEPCITNLYWSDIQQLFNIASSIKQTKSPVFASKMCHFLFPKLFIVIDNKATGVGHYELIWRGLKDAWSEFQQKEESKVILFSAIKNGKNILIYPNYPVETTIMEICTTSYNHREDNR
jgi:hypothetical protein